MKIYPIYKKVIQQVIGNTEPNFTAKKKPAIRVLSFITNSMFIIRGGVKYTIDYVFRRSQPIGTKIEPEIGVTIEKKPAAKLNWYSRFVGAIKRSAIKINFSFVSRIQKRIASKVQAVSSGSVSGATNPAGGVSTDANGALGNVQSLPEASVTKLSIAYGHNKGSVSVSEYAVGGRTDWSNSGNAAGNTNGSNADIEGSSGFLNGTTNRGGLNFNFTDINGKDDITLTACYLRFYGELSGVALGNGSLTFRFSRDGSTGGRTDLLTINSNTDFSSSTPIEIDIADATIGGGQANGIRNWADVRALTAQVEFNGAPFSNAEGAIDACHLIVYGFKESDI